MLRPHHLMLASIVAASLACGTEQGQVEDDDAIGFVALLGTDTLAVERFEHSALAASAQVVLRSPRTTYREYSIEFDGFGNLVRYEATVRVPDAPVGAAPLRRDVVVPVGDSLRIRVTERGATEERLFPAERSALPFIDMVHWPLDIALRRAHASGRDSVVQPMFAGQGSMSFLFRRVDSLQVAIVHPFRGTMHAEVDSTGALQRLDARATTQELMVHRVPAMDIEPFVTRFGALDAAGLAFGELSGRGETIARIDGATVRVDYGRPSRRGRTIFGEVVPFGAVWRTGANQATHFESDRDLAFGEFVLPAGQHTLFSIPDEDSAILVFNTQTGQNGNSHDASRDLLRLEMRREVLDHPVEQFTILIEETERGGRLILAWEHSSYMIPFSVMP